MDKYTNLSLYKEYLNEKELEEASIAKEGEWNKLIDDEKERLANIVQKHGVSEITK